MLFMAVYSWDTDKRDEIIKRRLEKGLMIPSKMKLLGEWTALGGNKHFSLVEADDARILAQSIIAWNDLLDLDLHVVVETEKDLMGLFK